MGPRAKIKGFMDNQLAAEENAKEILDFSTRPCVTTEPTPILVRPTNLASAD